MGGGVILQVKAILSHVCAFSAFLFDLFYENILTQISRSHAFLCHLTVCLWILKLKFFLQNYWRVWSCTQLTFEQMKNKEYCRTFESHPKVTMVASEIQRLILKLCPGSGTTGSGTVCSVGIDKNIQRRPKLSFLKWNHIFKYCEFIQGAISVVFVFLQESKELL